MSEMFDYILQSIAVITLIVGLWLAGNKDKRGPLLAVFSEFLWIVVGFLHGVWGLVCLSIILAVVQARAWWKWRNE